MSLYLCLMFIVCIRRILWCLLYMYHYNYFILIHVPLPSCYVSRCIHWQTDIWWNTFMLILLDYIKVMFEFTKGKFREVPMSYFCCSCALLLLFKPILNLRRPLDFVSVLIYACISIVSLDCYLHLWFILLVLHHPSITSIPIVYRS